MQKAETGVPAGVAWRMAIVPVQVKKEAATGVPAVIAWRMAIAAVQVRKNNYLIDISSR
jgi:hypothetical protein